MSGVSGISNNFSFQLMVGEELKLVESTVFEYGWMPEIGELKKDIEKCLHENWKSSYLLIYTEFQINVNEKDSAKINPFWFLNTFLDAHNAKKLKNQVGIIRLMLSWFQLVNTVFDLKEMKKIQT